MNIWQKIRAYFVPTFSTLRHEYEVMEAKKYNEAWLEREEEILLKEVKDQLERASKQLNDVLTKQIPQRKKDPL